MPESSATDPQPAANQSPKRQRGGRVLKVNASTPASGHIPPASRRRARIAGAVLLGVAAMALAVFAIARADAEAWRQLRPRRSVALSPEMLARIDQARKLARNPGATIIHVDDDANTNGDGTSWATAFADLQDALDAARILGGAPAEIWIAEGTYTPDRGTGNRLMRFEMVGSTGLFGGFAGDEADFDNRDIAAHETILSGDLVGNDAGTTGMEENSEFVVSADAASPLAVLDGVVVEGAYQGSGIFAYDSNILVRDCVVRRNAANLAGVYSKSYGGGVFAYRGSLTIVRTVFRANRAERDGGGAYFDSCAALVQSCRFEENSAYQGGAVAVRAGDVVAMNTLFANNVAAYGGGCANDAGGGARGGFFPSYFTWINCTIFGNMATTEGGGVHSYSYADDAFASVFNCILWSNVDSVGVADRSQIVHDGEESVFLSVQRSCVQGWTGQVGGTGNTGADPGFVDAVSGDFRLRLPSSAIDAGDNGYLPPGALTDLAGGGRFVDHPQVADAAISTNGMPAVDMGAFEWFDPDCNSNGVLDVLEVAAGSSADANSNSVPDECDPECNGNAVLDIVDIAVGTSADLNGNLIPDECESDCNANNQPDDYDLAVGSSGDCNNNQVPDECDVAAGTSADCNANIIPDECEPDCNSNGVADGCDIAAGTSNDFDVDGVPDECEPDCNSNGFPDDHDLALGTSLDCNANSYLDDCEVAAGTSADCNANDVPDGCEPDCNSNAVADGCDIASGASNDCDADDVPDECALAGWDLLFLETFPIDQVDTSNWAAMTGYYYRSNYAPSYPYYIRLSADDAMESQPIAKRPGADAVVEYALWAGWPPAAFSVDYWTGDRWETFDTHTNDGTFSSWARVSVEIEGAKLLDRIRLRFRVVAPEGSGIWHIDDIRVVQRNATDCNSNGVLDICDTAAGTSVDVNTNSFPDECEPDCNRNGVPDGHDLDLGTSLDCNGNAVPDSCDLSAGTSTDCNLNAVPDACEIADGLDQDCDANGVLDSCDIASAPALDCDGNSVLDVCDIAAGSATDCDGNLRPDSCDLADFGDCNANGIPDACDADCDANGVPDGCELPGDLNHDGWVDADDLTAMLTCLSAPCIAPLCAPVLYADPCCASADSDDDGDVDLRDFDYLQRVFSRVCYAAADCDDGLFCTGEETCAGGLCRRGTYPCTDPVYSVCVEETDFCTYPPLLSYADDFEAYACGGEPDDWRDTAADNSLAEDDTLFAVGCLPDTRALATASTETNVHSHYHALGAADFSSITFTGRMLFEETTGGIGVTFVSQFPTSAAYYRLRRTQWTPNYHLAQLGTSITGGATDTGFVPLKNTWYRFVIEVAVTPSQTEIRAKLWREGAAEPAAWQIDCYDASPTRLTQGTIGVWSMGAGSKAWDNLEVAAQQP